MGLVNRVVPAAELEACAKDYAEMIGGNAPLTIAAVKSSSPTRRPDGLPSATVARCAAMVERTASTARTISRAAAPSWKSASRRSPGRERGPDCDLMGKTGGTAISLSDRRQAHCGEQYGPQQAIHGGTAVASVELRNLTKSYRTR